MSRTENLNLSSTSTVFFSLPRPAAYLKLILFPTYPAENKNTRTYVSFLTLSSFKNSLKSGHHVLFKTFRQTNINCNKITVKGCVGTLRGNQWRHQDNSKTSAKLFKKTRHYRNTHRPPHPFWLLWRNKHTNMKNIVHN